MNVAQVSKYLKEINFSQNPKISKLPKGESNENFLIEENDKKFVLRKSRSDVPTKDRLYNEYIILKFLEEQKINFVPRGIYYDKKEKINIVSYIYGQPCSLSKFNSKQIIGLVKHLSQITAISYRDFLNFCQKNNFPKPKIEKDEDMLKKYTIQPYGYLKRHCDNKKIIEWAKLKVVENRKLSKQGKGKLWFSHGDLTNNLIINKGKIYIIDWEFARFVFSKGDETGTGYVLAKEGIKNNLLEEFIQKYSEYKKIPFFELKKRLFISFKMILLNDVLWAAKRYTEMKLKGMRGWRKYYKMTWKRIKRYEDKIKNSNASSGNCSFC